jgi:hypothetical protein
MIDAMLDGKRIFLQGLLEPRYRDGAHLQELSREFEREGYVHLPGLFRAGVFSAIEDELLSKVPLARSRNFVMSGYETPRVMSVMGGSFLLRETDLVWPLYSHWELRKLVAAVAGAPVYPCLHPEEFMVANVLLASGNTHGWHLDDPAYALIVFIESPAPEAGGLLEYVPRWGEFCRAEGFPPEESVDAAVERARERGRVRVKGHARGDAYLLRADLALHRVTSLAREGARRVALNLAFEATESPSYGNTASELYGE